MFPHSPNKGLKLKHIMTSSCRHVSDETKRRHKELRRMKEKIRVEQSMKFDFKKKSATVERYNQLQQYPYPLQIPKGEKKDTSLPLTKTYCPLFTEPHWYDWWEREKFFQSSNDSSKRKFSMVIPPPNVTGRLHMGHALTTTIEDIMARWHRMLGYDVSWLPGSDHAGIATQIVVEKFIQKELGETKHSLGAEQFREAIWKWKDKKGVEIYEQLRRIGASLDWSRTCFTLDDNYYDAVIEAFVRLHEQGLIYRAEKMINWSPHMSTSLSDIEMDVKVLDDPVAMKVPGYKYPVQFGILHKFAYKLQDPVDDIDEVVVATSRVETLFGDVAVAVNPNDERYRKLIGRRLVHPFFLDREVIVVGDSGVDITKGTGAVKITPAHDRVDFEIGSRHRLPKIESVDQRGKIVIDHDDKAIWNRYHGMKQFDARNKIINHLVDLQLYRGQMKYQAVARFCGRTGDVIESRIKRQWFVKVEDMCRKSLEAVKDGKLEFVQDKYINSWSSWLESAEDWCVSRSLWWGHHIPAYKITTNYGTSEWVVARNEKEARSKARVKLGLSSTDQFTMERDSDVLDTWFSSAIFPFAAYGWPDNNADVNKYYPLDVMETGHDLLFFWVARMTMMGIQLTGQVPFKQVLFHPMVCDDYGRKMSKSLGNVIDPMHVVDGCTIEEKLSSVADMCLDEKENKLAVLQMKKHGNNMSPNGSDSLRHSLCLHSLQKDQIDYSVNDTKHSRKFLNKMWNSFILVACMIKDDRLLHEKMSEGGFDEEMKNHLQDVDWWINTKLYDVIEESEKYLQNHQYSLYLSNVQHFWANSVCDWYLEACKWRFRRDYDQDSRELHIYSDNEETAALQLNLIRIADSFLRLLHPVLPFITEELWQRIPASFVLGYNKPDSICVSPYPVPANYQDLLSDRSVSERVEKLLNLVALYRSQREMYSLPRNSKVAFKYKDETSYQQVAKQTQLLKQLLIGIDCRILGPSDTADDDIVKSGYIALRSQLEPFDVFFRPESMSDYVGNANIDALLRKRLKNLIIKTPDDERIQQIEQFFKQRKQLMKSL